MSVSFSWWDYHDSMDLVDFLNYPTKTDAANGIEKIAKNKVKKAGFEVPHRYSFLDFTGWSTDDFIAQGTYAKVYKVQRGETMYAAKQIAKHADCEQLLTERKYHCFLNSDFIVPCYFSFQSATHVCMIMELMNGTLREYRRSLLFEQRLFYSVKLAEAIMYLHSKNLIHMDLKPSNILISSKFALKLGDLGLTKPCLENQTIRNCCGGTNGYKAPENFSGQFSQASDNWSYAAILFLLFSPSCEDLILSNKTSACLSFVSNSTAIFKRLNVIENLEIRNFISKFFVSKPNERSGLKAVIDAPIFNGYSSSNITLDEFKSKYPFQKINIPLKKIQKLKFDGKQIANQSVDIRMGTVGYYHAFNDPIIVAKKTHSNFLHFLKSENLHLKSELAKSQEQTCKAEAELALQQQQIVDRSSPILKSNSSLPKKAVKNKSTSICKQQKPKRYPCTGCELSFSHASSYSRHKKTHTEATSMFKCTHTKCKKEFSRNDNLTQHMRTHETFKCQKCSTKYNSLTMLTNHHLCQE